MSVHLNGEDNNYPERVERTINNSATAKPAAETLKKFIIGQGFEQQEFNDVVVNKKTGATLRMLLSQVAQSYAWQKGVAVHANYNANYKISDLKVLPFGHCRVGKKDDTSYAGKIGLHDQWYNKSIKAKDIKMIDVFNPLEKVVKEQIRAAKDIKNFKGQIHFFHPDDTIYPLAHIDNVMYDADSEYQAAVFKNRSLRKGYFGNLIFLTPPLLGELAKKPPELMSPEELKIFRHLNSERGNFKEVIKQSLGAENVGGVVHMEVEHQLDDIKKAFEVVKIDTNIDDKVFEYTETSAANNIRKANQNIPAILIDNRDNSVFGDSGKKFKEAKIYYSEQTQDEREFIDHHINELMKHFEGFEMPKGGLKIKPLVNPNQANVIDN